jgi:hypothetical protein
MPLTGSDAVFGAAMVVATQAPLSNSTSVGHAFNTFLVGNCITLPGSMTAAGAAVTGTGALSFAGGAGNSLGDALRAAVPATDTPSIALWRAIGNAIVNHLTAHGGVNPSGFVANPVGGAVTGAGMVSVSPITFSPTLAVDLGLVDLANQGFMLAWSNMMMNHVISNAVALSLGFTSPNGGGSLVGASTIS